jgi:hypothetical protein
MFSPVARLYARIAVLGAGMAVAAASLLAARAQGEEAGLADAVVAGIAVYEAAVFPLAPGGVSEAEQKARRTVAYQLAAHEDLPNAVRLRRPRPWRPSTPAGTATAPGPR